MPKMMIRLVLLKSDSQYGFNEKAAGLVLAELVLGLTYI